MVSSRRPSLLGVAGVSPPRRRAGRLPTGKKQAPWSVYWTELLPLWGVSTGFDASVPAVSGVQQ
jgi:hypothetical protein